MDDFSPYSASALAKLLQNKSIGVEELARYYLSRIDKYDGPNGLNAVCEIDEQVLAHAKAMDSPRRSHTSPLFGLPLLLKDNIDAAGLHTAAGSLALADNVASRDARIVANLRRSGALILGKTNMTEFANYTGDAMPGGYSSRGGQVKSAYDPAKSPSGSSSGSAVAVSAGLCAAAVGTDTSFSIVGCATENGVTGYKPPAGALSSAGILPLAHTLDSAGPITHGLADAILVYSGMRNTPIEKIAPVRPDTLRIAVNTFHRDQVGTRQLAKYDAVLDALRQEGGAVTEVSHADTPYQRDVMRCEFRHDVEAYLAASSATRRTLKDIVAFYEANPETMPYGIARLRDALDNAAGRLDDSAYLEALAERKRLKAEILESLRGIDACLMTGPTNIMHFIG
ncbi:MAG: amidase family protein, partial [Oscillospiraceae bacterium]|nr:amidase family protein [Oscillospiraceae bacterium]